VSDKNYSAKKPVRMYSSPTFLKAFGEYFLGFVECFRHSAKRLFPVVLITEMHMIEDKN
jgi:hypothetical protein